MENNQNKKWVAWAVIVVIVIIAGIFLLPKSIASKYKNIEAFAKCLTDKGAVMYGAYWCGHCQNQKLMFGNAFKYVKYVECTENPKECEAVGINVYPTWKIASTTLTGEIPLPDLAKETGCVLEEKD